MSIFIDYVGMLATAGASTLSIVYDESVAGFLYMATGAQLIARDNKIKTKVYNIPASSNPSLLNINVVKNISTIFIETKPDAIILATGNCYQFLSYFKSLDYFPKSISVIGCPEKGNEFTYHDDIKYISNNNFTFFFSTTSI